MREKSKGVFTMKGVSIYESRLGYGNVLQFTLPTIIMIVFASMYGIIDGIVVANFIGSDALAANNIVYPLVTVIMAVNYMFATGGNAVIARKMGEGRQQEANRFLTAVVLASTLLTAVLCAIMLANGEMLYRLLGADEVLLPLCVEYGSVMMVGGVFYALQILFQNFLVTAERPSVGMGLTIAAGLTHILLDLLFIPVLGMGISGAAYASVLSMMVAGLPPLVMFAGKKQRLRFARLSGRDGWDGIARQTAGDLLRELGFAMCNGSSEMVTNLATAVTTMLFNIQMMHLAGEKGVAAISAVLYVESLFIGVFMGFSAGVAPLLSYQFGSGNRQKLARLMQISMTVIGVSSLVMFGSAQLLARPIIAAFAGGDSQLLSMALHGLRIFSFSYLLGGVSIFASALFTALNNGGISALISLVRTLVMRCGLLILLPALLGIDGVWLAVPAAEVFAALLSAGLIFGFRRRYGYWPVQQMERPVRAGKPGHAESPEHADLPTRGRRRHGTAVCGD
ncbi:MAG: MATE family efflux transporter [Firmicutes bacterium]|nr:MATE family efflux transporter [Bacillota bacterium]MDY5856748.1 MATE family efflux transporter [Anaerovoracaceae bacterium]